MQTDSSKCETASDFLSLVNEKVIVTMVHFIFGFYIKYWLAHFIIMQQHEPLVRNSNCISRHMAIQFFKMNKELNQLESPYEFTEDFLPFSNIKKLHIPEEQLKLC